MSEQTTVSKIQALKELSDGYSQYFDVSQVHTHMSAGIGETIEQMLTQLDELNALIHSTQSSTRATQDSITSILAHTARLEETYAIIDAYQIYISTIEAMVTRAEERTSAIEQQYSFHIAEMKEKAKSFLSTFGIRKSTTQAPPTNNIIAVPELNVIDTKQLFDELKKKALVSREPQSEEMKVSSE
ncbi:hypothetical protein PROFUN_11275 [Planoprotostelium fungivorum]|uniref:Uncharacterized protein n=1 Tax=Planoprotostelium fungivorum TaxID=1890364 RepID=A0A2P6NAG8_9EUKA|nr:hypothetical protein PROFUN_11275 [Planoprotostelium fungivorum]